MIQRSGVARFARSRLRAVSSSVRRPEHFERDLTVESRVVREEHDTHPSAAERGLNLVRAEQSARRQGHVNRLQL